MIATDRYRDQHRELLRIVGVVKALLDPVHLAEDPIPVYEMLMTLTGKLKVHLTMEDQRLYPLMLAHHEEKVREMSRAYQDEMGGLMDAYDDFIGRWAEPENIRKEPVTFISEIEAIFKALRRRIEKEDKQLYVMLDLLG